MRRFIPLVAALPLLSVAILPAQAPAPACPEPPAPPASLDHADQCTKCQFHYLPGKVDFTADTRWTIHSDMPEVMLTDGVLYTTRAVLPPFQTKAGVDVPEDFRTQKNNSFTSIDDDFEVFLFHISQPGDGTKPRRVVVYVANRGDEAVIINPRQVIATDGTIGTIHEMESGLGRRVMEGKWDTPLSAQAIAPGKGAVVAYSKQFAAPKNSDDSSANVNCFGIVQGAVSTASGKPAKLEVSIVGIPAGPANQATTAAEALLAQGAQSGEGYIDVLSDPQGCQLRRATGVFRSFAWRSDTVTLDAANLPKDGLAFQMAAGAIQTKDCPEGRQTGDLALYPRYVRPDTIGNYMTEYRATFKMVNTDKEKPRTFDIRFGKKDADVGLAWQVAVDPKAAASDAALKALPVRTAWAGPKQTADLEGDWRSFFEQDKELTTTLAPCGETWVSLRFMVLGNSSLPFQVGVVEKP